MAVLSAFVPRYDADYRATSRTWRINRRLAACLILALCAVAVGLIAPLKAGIAFTLRVDGRHAILEIDRQRLRANWPAGITRAQIDPIAPAARLFRTDGTDSSGTLTAPPIDPRAPAGSVYERFLCWMRECGTYSQWRDLALRDDRTGRQVLVGGTAASLARLALPTHFTLRGTLQRPDVGATILFVGKTRIALTIDTDRRSVSLGDQHVYFPHDWRPFLAEVGWTLSRAYLWAIAVLALIVALGLACLPLLSPLRRLLHPLHLVLARFPAQWRRPVLLPAFLVGAILATLLWISSSTYERLPRIFDGVSYYFQAAILRSGNLWVPVPRALDNFPGPFMVSMHGHWFSHYPPGAPLAIALGMLVGLPWVVEPLLGAVSAVLLWRMARRWYGQTTALLVLVLLALSPFFLFLAASYLSHLVALCALLLFLEGIDRLTATADWRWAVLAGLGAGYALLTRELDLILFALPVLAFYGVYSWPQLTRRVRMDPREWDRLLASMLGVLVPLLLCLLFYFFYNWRLTGDAWLTPRVALDLRDSWGFGVGKGWYNLHTVAAGFFVLENQLTSLLIDLYGWPYYLTLSFFLLPLATLRLYPHDLLLYAIAAIFLLGYAGYFYHGIAFGPRYLFVSLPAYVVLTARGMAEAAALTGRLVQRLTGSTHSRSAGLIGAALLALALVACNLGYYLPRQFTLYHDYLEQRVDSGLAYDRLHPSWLHHAVVISDDWAFYADVLFPLNDPLLQGDVLYVYVPDNTDIHNLLVAYAGRTIYRLRLNTRQVHIQPVGGSVSEPAAHR